MRNPRDGILGCFGHSSNAQGLCGTWMPTSDCSGFYPEITASYWSSRTGVLLPRQTRCCCQGTLSSTSIRAARGIHSWCLKRPSFWGESLLVVPAELTFNPKPSLTSTVVRGTSARIPTTPKSGCGSGKTTKVGQLGSVQGFRVCREFRVEESRVWAKLHTLLNNLVP